MSEQWHSFFEDSALLAKHIQQHRAISQNMQERFNIFEIVSDTHCRENFHSDVIAYLLNPNQKHGLGTEPLRLFVQWLKHSQGGQPRVPQTEKLPGAGSLQTAETMREHERIDVLVEGEKHCIIIENKINWADDQPAQLQRYYKYISQNKADKDLCAIVYLTPDGHPPTSQSKGKRAEEIDAVLYNVKTYPDSSDDSTSMLTGWLDPLLAHAKTLKDGDVSSDVVSFLRQYIILLRKLGEEFMNDENANEFLEILTSEKQGGKINPVYYEVAHALCSGSIDIRDITAKHLLNTLQKDIDNSKGLKHKFIAERDDDKDVFSVCFDFRLSNNRRYGIALVQYDWDKSYWIEVFFRDRNGSSKKLSKNDLSALKEDILPSVVKKYDCCISDEKDRLYIGTEQGFQYVGNETEFRSLVIKILKAFEAYAQTNNLEFLNN